MSDRPTSKPPRMCRSSLDNLPVLVVEDDASNAKLMTVLLQAEGCQTRTVENAEQALEAIAEQHPRLIVLDLVLALMSGLLLTQRLKADPATRDIVIIAVTAFNGGSAERVALDAGCSAYVRKPIDPSSFTQLLLAHLGTPS